MIHKSLLLIYKLLYFYLNHLVSLFVFLHFLGLALVVQFVTIFFHILVNYYF
jgi:hypothetical protein